MENTFLEELDYLIRVKRHDLKAKREHVRKISGSEEDNTVKAWAYAKRVSEAEVIEAELHMLERVKEKYLQFGQYNK